MKKEDIESYLKETFDKGRQIYLFTGRGGAMEFEVQCRILAGKNEDTARKEVEAMIWEDGAYTSNPVTGALEYRGLFDSSMPDGHYGIIRHGLYYIEHWEHGQRVNYKIVSEEEFNKLKSNVTLDSQDQSQDNPGK